MKNYFLFVLVYCLLSSCASTKLSENSIDSILQASSSNRKTIESAVSLDSPGIRSKNVASFRKYMSDFFRNPDNITIHEKDARLSYKLENEVFSIALDKEVRSLAIESDLRDSSGQLSRILIGHLVKSHLRYLENNEPTEQDAQLLLQSFSFLKEKVLIEPAVIVSAVWKIGPFIEKEKLKQLLIEAKNDGEKVLAMSKNNCCDDANQSTGASSESNVGQEKARIAAEKSFSERNYNVDIALKANSASLEIISNYLAEKTENK